MTDDESGVIHSPAHRAIVTCAVMLATTIYALDITIVSVALPHMQGTFSATTDEIAWVATSYIIAAAIITPVLGPVANRIGRKKVFLLGVAGFTLASLLCGLATSLEMEVTARILQGISAAPFAPISQAVMTDIFPKAQRGTANAIWGMGLLVGQILGPTLGGWLTDEFSWTWVFLINVPIGVAAFALTAIFLPARGERNIRPFDWFGYTALAFGIAALQLMLDRGDHLDWFASTEIVLEASVTALGFYIFVTHSLTAKNPFISPGILRDRNAVVGYFVVFIYGMVMFLPVVLTPLLLFNLAGYPILTIGLLMSTRGASAFITMYVTGRIQNRVDVRPIMALGFALAAFASWLMSRWSLDVGPWEVAWTGLIFGLGVGFAWVPLSAMTLSTLPAPLRTEGTSLFHLWRMIGTSIGLSGIISVVTVTGRESQQVLREAVSVYNPAFQRPGLPGSWDISTAQGLAAVQDEIVRQASMIGFNNAFLVIACFAAAIAPVAWLFPRPAYLLVSRKAEAEPA